MIYLLVSLVILALLFLAVAVQRTKDCRKQLRTAELRGLAASWLANYHARYAWALQDYVADREHISYQGVWVRAEAKLVMARRSRMSLYCPLDKVPAEMMEAAKAYNEATFAHLPVVFTGLVDASSPVRDLHMVGNYRRYARRITEHTGEDPDVIDGVLETLDGMIAEECIGDPEEVLPSAY